MPHVVFDRLGSVTTTDRGDARKLIPGIEPGGSRAGQDFKPALLIKDAWLEPISVSVNTIGSYNAMTYGLILSNDQDLNPGLALPIGTYGAEVAQVTAVGVLTYPVSSLYEHLFRAQGSIWAPEWVGIYHNETGTAATDVDVHLDYEMVMIPWMEWFIMSEWIDGVTDGQRDY